MILMNKDGKNPVLVPDAHIDAYKRKGYVAVNSDDAAKFADERDLRIRALEDENSTLKAECDNLRSELAQVMAANESCAATIKTLEDEITRIKADDAPPPPLAVKNARGKKTTGET